MSSFVLDASQVRFSFQRTRRSTFPMRPLIFKYKRLGREPPDLIRAFMTSLQVKQAHPVK
jgi:hypothetical protein